MKDLSALSLRLTGARLFVLDQQMLPGREDWIAVQSPQHMVHIIRALKVRGAPLIGVAACLSLAVWSQQGVSELEFVEAAELLRQSRPTAVNLMNGLERMLASAREFRMDPDAILGQAIALFEEDITLCQQMAQAGAALVEDGDAILTHCNTGGLATVGVGTALGVITEAHRQGKAIHVYVDETRPLLQGARLTTWELDQAGVPYTLICDNMSGSLMAQGKVSRVFLGADRIALNGDFANKIGTYNVAVLSQFHRVPFYVVAPSTTIDRACAAGAKIPVEMRDESEVKGAFGDFGEVRWAPAKARACNPAFDVTPVGLLTAMVIDQQVLRREELLSGGLGRLSRVTT